MGSAATISISSSILRSISSSVRSLGSVMAKAPYPGYSPNYTLVEVIGDLKRQCWVLEVCTNSGLDLARMAQLEDEITMLLESKFPEIMASKVVRSDQFDTDLRRAMRTN